MYKKLVINSSAEQSSRPRKKERDRREKKTDNKEKEELTSSCRGFCSSYEKIKLSQIPLKELAIGYWNSWSIN